MHTDVALLSRANRRYINILAEAGVTFFLMPQMNHAKLLFVDESLALLGSANLGALSFDFNTEVGIFLTDPKMLADIETIVNGWKVRAKLLERAFKVSIADRLLSFIVRLSQPFL